ncbi:monovalent cation:proton antiporter, putative [Ricinus communis]|uniref:Monovalent cation:proton antiporter, putative n=1 Tax=Ricinus communis TaxID=3988 RepID=B9S490_RICCO|nr:monovalent cation:proton antiporter, putative [Ricinus communis]
MAFIGYMFKLLATFIFVLAVKINLEEAVVLALILNVKGPREMGTFFLFFNIELDACAKCNGIHFLNKTNHLQTRDLESTSGILLIFLITSYIPPLIKMIYDPSKHYVGYKKKCIQHTPNDAKLEILACANKQEDALSAIRLLELSNPSKESPMTVYGLCLEELLGSDAPYTINHQFGQKKSASRGSRSQPIVDIFKYFMLEHENEALVEVYTAVSPLKSMHEDICWQAFDKTCSLIVLPFHQKWNNRGNLVSNSSELRNLNINVLERAPCSVGILIDRSRSQGLSSIFAPSAIYRVAVLFVGGKDDREALAYALRMAGSRKVQLTVLCFITLDDTNTINTWEDMLDHEALRKLKHAMSMTNSNIKYIEETVGEGSDAAAIVRSAQENYDLILVGCRHESKPEAISGLSQWTEFPELGALGDQLATSEITTSVSILVVQQQILKASHSSVLN